jgi:SCY1-like protein 1
LILTFALQEDGSNCSIFSFDVSANRSALPLAKNALKKLRTLRHPGVIKVLDTAEVRHLLSGGGADRG